MYQVAMVNGEKETISVLFERILDRKGHGYQQEIIDQTGISRPTLHRFRKTGHLSEKKLKKLTDFLHSEGYFEEIVGIEPAPGTENPMAAPDPVERLAVALRNASLMVVDTAPLDDRLDALEHMLRYVTDKLIPEMRKKDK
jgi:hypothetical protein